MTLTAWLLLPAVAAPVVAAWPAWRDWSHRRRRWHALVAVPLALALFVLSAMLLEEMVRGSPSPILAHQAPWLVAALGVGLLAGAWAASRVSWTGHWPWLVLAAPLVILLLEASGNASRPGDGRAILALLAALALAATLPWALHGAVAGRGPAWRAQAAVLGLAAVPLLMMGLGGLLPTLVSEGPGSATDTVTVQVEPESDAPFEVLVRPPWDHDGPWMRGLLDQDPERFLTVDGNGSARIWNARIVVTGTGPVTVTLDARYYGPIEMLESDMHGEVEAESDAPVRLRVEHRNRSPLCQFTASWAGSVPGGEHEETLLPEGEAVGQCA